MFNRESVYLGICLYITYIAKAITYIVNSLEIAFLVGIDRLNLLDQFLQLLPSEFGWSGEILLHPDPGVLQDLGLAEDLFLVRPFLKYQLKNVKCIDI